MEYNNPSNWSIELILDAYANAKSKLKLPHIKEIDNLKKLYCTAMRLAFKNEFGNVFTVDDFICRVNEKAFTDYDGIGYFATIVGEEKEAISCNVQWLEKHRKNYPFIIWYNK